VIKIGGKYFQQKCEAGANVKKFCNFGADVSAEILAIFLQIIQFKKS
jgi:hypothetical protein